jgi:hypothetical protein
MEEVGRGSKEQRNWASCTGYLTTKAGLVGVSQLGSDGGGWVPGRPQAPVKLESDDTLNASAGSPDNL